MNREGREGVKYGLRHFRQGALISTGESSQVDEVRLVELRLGQAYAHLLDQVHELDVFLLFPWYRRAPLRSWIVRYAPICLQAGERPRNVLFLVRW
jgi:hypothetical protein